MEVIISLRQAFKVYQESQRKSDEELQVVLRSSFSSSENPHENLLYLVTECGDFYQSKANSLSAFVLEFFQKWTSENPGDYAIGRPLKEKALHDASSQSNSRVTGLVIDIFEIKKEDPDSLYFLVENLVDRHSFTEACRIVSMLGIYGRVTIFDFILPLIGQDKTNVVEQFLSKCPELQIELIRYLDSCIPDSNTLKDMLMKRGVQSVQYSKLRGQPFSKLVARLAKRYNVPANCTVNLSHRQQLSSLRYMLQQCFDEKVMAVTNFEELATLSVKDSERLQLELLEMLINNYHENEIAVRMARNFGLPHEKWPSSLKKTEAITYVVRAEENLEAKISSVPSKSTVKHPVPASSSSRTIEPEWSESWTGSDTVAKQETYKLDIPLEHVIFINDLEGFDRFLENLRKETLIGIDAEWLPTFDSTKSPVSLIQIATGSASVYILDMIILAESLSEEKRGDFVSAFYRKDLLVLGFGFREDLKKLNGVFPRIHDKHETSNNLLDMLKLWAHLQMDRPKVLPFIKTAGTGKERQKGLSEFVRQCFDKVLDKTEQMSDWTRRPLRESQVIYAALDAITLVKAYQFLSSQYESEEWNTLVDTLIRHKKAPKPPKKVRKEQAKTRDLNVLPLFESPVPPSGIKLICLTSVLGRLGRLLRSCGIDTVLTHSVSRSMTDQEIVELARKENRFVISTGGPARKLGDYLPIGHCYRVISSDPAIQLKEVLVYFKCRVELKHIFSRCQKCNGNNYHKITQYQMLQIDQRSKESDSVVTAIVHPRAIDMTEQSLVTEKSGVAYDWSISECADQGMSLGQSIPEFEFRKPVNLVEVKDLGMERNIVELETAFVSMGRTRENAVIAASAVPVGVLQSVQIFYACCGCGKVYWEGSHVRKVLQGCLKHALIISDESKSVE